MRQFKVLPIKHQGDQKNIQAVAAGELKPRQSRHAERTGAGLNGGAKAHARQAVHSGNVVRVQPMAKAQRDEQAQGDPE